MPLNISKITRARNIFYADIFSNGALKVQFGGKRSRKCNALHVACNGVAFNFFFI